MKCEDVIARLDAISLDAISFGEGQGNELEEHARSCTDCAKRIATHQQYVMGVEHLAHTSLVSGDLQYLLDNAKGVSGKTRAAKSFDFFAVGGAMAATCIVGLSLVAALFSDMNRLNWTSGVVEPQITEIIVVINSPTQLVGATIAFDLPKGLAYAGLAQYQSFELDADLSVGMNEFVLPVAVTEPSLLLKELTLEAMILYEDTLKSYELPLKEVGDRPAVEA